jgi:uncharacterized protein
MLSFDIRALESKAVHVEGRLPADDPIWQDGDPRPAEPIRVSGRLSPAGAGRFYFSGRFEGATIAECRRCLTDVEATVGDDAHFIFAEPATDGADDPDVYPVDPRGKDLDLRPAVRELWLLAAPRYVQCREDCKGLCPKCGADLNAGPCGCTESTDARWDALRSARNGGSR